MATHFSGPVISTAGFQGGVQGGVQNNVDQIASADGAITAKSGLVVITKGSAAALTLAAPTAGTDDGKILTILSTTAFAHTVTQAAPGFNGGGGGSDVATYGAAARNSMIIQAYNGNWYAINLTGVTLA